MARTKGELSDKDLAGLAMVVSLPEFIDGYLSAKERDEDWTHCPYIDAESTAAKIWLQGNALFYLHVELSALMVQAQQLAELLQYNGPKQ